MKGWGQGVWKHGQGMRNPPSSLWSLLWQTVSSWEGPGTITRERHHFLTLLRTYLPWNGHTGGGRNLLGAGTWSHERPEGHPGTGRGHTGPVLKSRALKSNWGINALQLWQEGPQSSQASCWASPSPFLDYSNYFRRMGAWFKRWSTCVASMRPSAQTLVLPKKSESRAGKLHTHGTLGKSALLWL
jgi:hypothetical protein